MHVLLAQIPPPNAEVRRSAVHTVSLFSLYVDDDVFIKVCRGLPPLAKGPVQTAAVRLQAACL